MMRVQDSLRTVSTLSTRRTVSLERFCFSVCDGDRRKFNLLHPYNRQQTGLSNLKMSIDSESISYILFYTLACLGSLLMPLLFFRRSRIICMRRIRERRWRVRVDDIEGEEVIIPRYSPDDPRYNPSKEEALETKKAYVLQQLGSCSMVSRIEAFFII